ncbi:hypothetical protein M513_07711 [Trichuris suis]|uniref:Helix-turn-helix domain-containing protein n=1 Tax=Trichuris suis TaxID=68888 RepID=A0A085M260_9BILA|nr:hypothetical protein M513_07711 [Trichuris suis]
MEKETDKTLPFLDALLIRTNEGLKTRVFRKSTHTDLYLNFSSHHPRSVMRGILSGMIDRAIHLCSPEYLPAELRYIRRIFYKNKYPKQFIDQVFRRKFHGQNPHKLDTLQHPCLVVPYIVGLGEKIVALGRRLGFRVFFKSSPNLRSLLRTDKPKIPRDKKLDLFMQSECECSAIYIGETGNTLEHRFNQHKNSLTSYNNAKTLLNQNGPPSGKRGRRILNPRATMERAVQASAVVEHASQCNRPLHPKVLCYENNLHLRRIKEAMYIKHNRTYNRDQGVDISDLWSNIIIRSKCCSIR